MAAATLPYSVLFAIFRFRHPGWLDPPWFVQHDFDLLDAQADVAACARVCRAWREPAQSALLMYPAVRLTWPNSVSFFGLVHRLRGDDDVTKHPRRFIRSVLLIYDSGSHLGHAAAHTAIKEVRKATVPNGGLYLDNFPSSLFFCLDAWALHSYSEPLAAFGVRCVDVGLGPTPHHQLEVPYGAPPGAGQPAPLVLPPMPGLRQLHLCNVECSAIFSGDGALDLTALETLSLNHCIFSPVAGRAFRNMTQLRHFFLADVVFSPALFHAVFDDWPPPSVDFCTFCLALTDHDEALMYPWSRWGIPEANRALSSHRPIRLVHEHDESGDSYRWTPTKRPQPDDPRVASFADRYLGACSVWALPAFWLPEPWTSEQDKAWTMPPFVSSFAYQIHPERVEAVRCELGLRQPRWSQGPPPGHPDSFFWFRMHRENFPRADDIAFHEYLASLVGVPVRIVVRGAQHHGWAEMYICLSPRQFDDALLFDAPSTTPPSEHTLQRLWRRIGPPLSGPRQIAVSKPGKS